MKYRIHKNTWNNWYGYAGRNRVKEFTDKMDAEEWLMETLFREEYTFYKYDAIDRDTVIEAVGNLLRVEQMAYIHALWGVIDFKPSDAGMISFVLATPIQMAKAYLIMKGKIKP